MEIPRENFNQKIETNSGTAIISIPENASYIQLAIKALEKQMPVKAIGKYNVCKRCGVIEFGFNRPNYCEYCGQKLDWSGKNDN